MKRNSLILNASSITSNVYNLDVIDKKEIENRAKLIKNYEKMVELNLKTLKIILNTENNKAYIIYNLGFVVELFLKMSILREDIGDIHDISSLKHNIPLSFSKIKESSNSYIIMTCDKIKHLMSLIKNKGKSIDYGNYHHFKYNHKLNDYNLIIEELINSRDIKYIKEVIECIEVTLNK